MQPAKTSETPVRNQGDLAITPGGILLASDGSSTAIHARPLARLIAAHRQLAGSVITVLPRSFDEAHQASTAAEFDPYGQPAEPISPSEKMADSMDGWSHEVVYGHAGTEIVRAAEVQQSQLIVLGLRHHAFVDRLFRDETALSVMQHATTPVLAIASSLNALPECVAVAIDFSRASIAALNIAASIVRPDGRLLLVNVSPHLSSQRQAPVPSTTLYSESIADTLIRMQHNVQAQWGVHTEAVQLVGPIVPELRMFLRGQGVELLALGKSSATDGHSRLGTVPTALARFADCSLLIAPYEELATAR